MRLDRLIVFENLLEGAYDVPGRRNTAEAQAPASFLFLNFGAGVVCGAGRGFNFSLDVLANLSAAKFGSALKGEVSRTPEVET